MRKATLAMSAALLLGGLACERAGGAAVRNADAQGSGAPVAMHVTSARPGTPADFQVVESSGAASAEGARAPAAGTRVRTPAAFSVPARGAVFSTTFRAAASGPPLQVDVVIHERGKPIRLTAQGRVVTVRRSTPGERVTITSGGYPADG
jgi:hypothetical protein